MSEPTEITTNHFLSWVHIGDLHIREAQDENYLDLLRLVDEVNAHLSDGNDFVFLPGDNADDGSEDQYRLVQNAVRRLQLPLHVITGDHDRKAGTLDLFQRYLEPDLYRATSQKGFRLLFLNAMDANDHKKFDFGPGQMKWIRWQLDDAKTNKLRPLVFTHLYPSELETQGVAFLALLREFNVELVEMGHTHYNELANDGSIIYVATRSTGQIEEGPPGVSVTTVDGDVVSWKFNQLGAWPFVMITSPADERLITRPHSPSHVVRGEVAIRASVWNGLGADTVDCSVGSSPAYPMHCFDGHWQYVWNSTDVPDGSYEVTVTAKTPAGQGQDRITIRVNQAGQYMSPERKAVDYENVIRSYPEKGIFGTELGPNENGTKGPWPSWDKGNSISR